MISIIIPTYNNQKTIVKCLNSIFKQTYRDFEIIIVNDGSTDKTKKILDAYQNRLTIINQHNQGAPIARNSGFKKSQGEYLFFCDADIILKPDALNKFFNKLKKNQDAAYAYSSFRFGWKKFKCGKFDTEKLKRQNFISTNSLIRRDYFPGFDPSLKKFQDWDLWLTILKNGGRGVWIDKILFRVQTKEGSMSNWLPSFVYKLPWLKLKHKDKYQQAREIIYRKHVIDK